MTWKEDPRLSDMDMAGPGVKQWDERQLGEWVYRVCVDFGASPMTAHRVAAEFLEGVRSMNSPEATLRSSPGPEFRRG